MAECEPTRYCMERFDNLTNDVNMIRKAVCGNGNPGDSLIARLENIEAETKCIRSLRTRWADRVIAFIIAVLLLYIGGLMAGCSTYVAKDEIAFDGPKRLAKKESTVTTIWKDISPPTHGKTTLEADEASTGATDWNVKAVKSLGGLNVLYIVGGLAIIGGLAGAFLFKGYLTGGAVAAGGGLCILMAATIQQYPWLLLGLPVLAAVGVVIYLLTTRKGKLVHDAFVQTVAGVQRFRDSTPGQKDVIDLTLASEQDAKTQRLIRQTKVDL